MVDVLPSARAWFAVLLRPRRVRGLVDCWSFYDPSAWEAPLELWEAGLQLGGDVLVPALLLCLVGACAPAPAVGRAVDAAGPPTSVQGAVVAALSPYTSALTSLPPTATWSVARQLAMAVLSPIALDLLCHHVAPIALQFLARFRVVLRSRRGPDAAAAAALARRVRAGRALRTRDYDLYLPPEGAAARGAGRVVPALLLFPGFGVGHGAYAEAAGRLADEGVPVLVASLEPFRLAHAGLGGDPGDVARWIRAAGRDVAEYYRRQAGDAGTGAAGNAVVVEWALGGHSMGGYHALRLTGELARAPPAARLPDGSTSRVRPRCAAWAAGTVVACVPDLRDAGTRVLVLLGSYDDFARFAEPRDAARLRARLPAGSRVTTLRGATHEGFASYAAAGGDGAPGGPGEVLREVQHAAAARLTARFLLEE